MEKNVICHSCNDIIENELRGFQGKGVRMVHRACQNRHILENNDIYKTCFELFALHLLRKDYDCFIDNLNKIIKDMDKI